MQDTVANLKFELILPQGIEEYIGIHNMIDIRVKETVSPDPQPLGDRKIYRYTT